MSKRDHTPVFDKDAKATGRYCAWAGGAIFFAAALLIAFEFLVAMFGRRPLETVEIGG